ncbi:MAG: 4Fe-4S dicluster domain-containing protein [Spirochaetaceae bacterium]|jgi:electron transport complex protein RnfC|nr:4Fe-4S dicluster domain-containing protein [Spirochaetaceae bacterium]
MKYYSFSKGGFNFEDRFAPARESSRLAFLPEIAIVPLSTETGARSYPVVSVGQHIEEGMLIARGQGSGSANIHSPIPGKLLKMIKWEPAAPFISDAFVIRLEGSFKKLGKPETLHEWTELNRFEIETLINSNGVIEMDGLGRPLCDIFSRYDAARESITLLVRCIFDDPWFAADYTLCKERTEAVVEGCLITAKAAGADRIVFAVSSNEKELCNLLLKAVKQNEAAAQFNISAFFTGSRYPQHSNFEVASVFSRYEKSENLPAGKTIILGPATMAAVYDAVVMRIPPLERYVAVGGSAVKHPAVIKARIGSRLRDLFMECGGFRCKPESAAASAPPLTATGSPLLGRAVSLDEPLLKTSRGVFALAPKKREAAMKTFSAVFPIVKKIFTLMSENVCINCGECRNVCPAKLDPEDIYKRIKNGRHDDTMLPLITRCLGCGCCEASCPSKLPLCAAIVRSTFKGAACAG